MSTVADVSGRVKKPLSEAQKDALRKAAEQRQSILAAFLHAVQSGDWTALAKEFWKVQGLKQKRQYAEDRSAEREHRKPRKVRHTVPAYITEPNSAIPYYIRVAPEVFTETWEHTPGYKLAVPDAGLAVNEDFTFQLYNAQLICDPMRLKDWLLNGTGAHDIQVLRGMGYPNSLADAVKHLKFPFGAILVYVPHVFLPDVYATKALWRLDEFNQMVSSVVERKMQLNEIMVN